MGLFGGFKGKLIGKQKKVKEERNRVVCVKFNTFSEFDDVAPSCSNQNPGPTEVVRERRRPTKPEIKSVFGPWTNGEVKNEAGSPFEAKFPANAAKSPIDAAKSPINAAKSPNGKISATKLSMEEIYGIDLIPTKSAAKSPTKESDPAKAAKTPTAKTSAQAKDTANTLYTAKFPSKAANTTNAAKSPPEAAKSPPETAKSPPPEAAKSPSKSANTANAAKSPPEAPKSPPKAANPPKAAKSLSTFAKSSTPATKSQAPKPPPAKTPTPAAQKKTKIDPAPVVTHTLQFPLQDSDSDDGNFKIHFAKIGPKFAELSDDDDWGGDDKDDLSPINYSSQATSIFFGGDEEPPLIRPRNVQINDDDGDFSDGSSASA